MASIKLELNKLRSVTPIDNSSFLAVERNGAEYLCREIYMDHQEGIATLTTPGNEANQPQKEG